MVDESGVTALKSTAAAAILESMQVVKKALMQPPGITPEQLVTRIQEWQQLVTELAEGPVKGAELATLYTIIGVLNSSLNLTETLSLVMDSLIHLTGAERGCLVLFDEEGNLEIRAAQNFDQESVDASDLQLSDTVVRDAVETGQPVLTTNAQLDPRFAGQESVIGYHLRSIVCVPLHVRDQVIGALYLDNRMREGVFSQEDMPLLAAFASQAAVAIENARLYTMTDQALAARVEELTTLQQIDRELNASLDVERVLDLTLSWAMRATEARRGTLSTLDEQGNIQTISFAGDGGAKEPESFVVQMAVHSHEPFVVGGTRMVVPIRYEDRTVGVLDLRNAKNTPFQTDSAEFAGRLADHAAVAIENARLYEQVRAANRAKSEFVSFVAHELGTPMTSVRGYAEMMIKGAAGSLTPDQEMFVNIINKNVRRMQILVSDLADISRIETRQLRLELKPTVLARALENAIEATQKQIEARAQELTMDVPENLPQISADPARLEQILINLLSNANKYTPKQGKITTRAWRKNGYVYCAVSDTGVGMSSQDLNRLFTKFFRSENPKVREMPGTGLGLCIVKSLVELQGGELQVQSQEGEGTTFIFTVPVASEE